MSIRKIIMSTLVLHLAMLIMFTNEEGSAANRRIAEAEWLNRLGLFQGTEAGWELERQATRAEGAVMLVRLLGKESASLRLTETVPFQDVPQWAYPSVAYLYNHKLSNGLSDAQYGSYSYLNASQYAAMLLRALGYREERGDFSPIRALDKMVQLDVIGTGEKKELERRKFTRGDIAKLSYQALKAPMKEDGKTLTQALIEQGVLTNEAAKDTGLIVPAPIKLEDLGGIQVTRPNYGTMNVVIRGKELYEPLKAGYSAVALQSFEKTDDYKQAIKELKDGSFHYKELLQTGRLANHNPIHSDPMPSLLYTHQLTGDASLLLNRNAQQKFAYVIVFYDAYHNPVYYQYNELPLIETKLSTNPTVVALMYHHFSEKEKELSSVTVHPDRFRSQLKALKAAGFVPIQQQDLLAFLKDRKGKLPEKSVIVTIDDGYESNYKLAYPILADEGFYATVFPVTSFRGKTPGVLPHFTWEQMLEMYNSGYMDFQNHTHNAHYYGKTANGTGPALTSRLFINNKPETKENYEKRILEDLKHSKRLMEEKVGNRVFALAYPYGRYNKSVIAAAVATGHSIMYTTKEGIIRKGSDPYTLPRINVDGAYSAEDLLKRIQSYL